MEEVKKRTVIVFPFEATLEDKTGAYKIQVHKLSVRGLIVEVPTASFRAQAPIKMKFTLPVENVAIEEECVIIKTYNQLIDEKSQKKRYLLEIHFKSIKPGNLASINELLSKLESKKKKKAN